MNGKKSIVFTVAVTVCLMSAMFAFRAYGGWPYDPWWDVNDDGKIDIKDLARVSGAFGTYGQNVSKAGLLYDSGWINVTDQTGQYYTFTHNLNNDSKDMTIDIHAKAFGWNRTYGGTNYEGTYSFIQAMDGGYAIACGTGSYGAGYYDAYIVKTDAFGRMEWNETYGGTGYDYAGSLVQTDDGGFAVAGTKEAYYASGLSYVWLIKTDTNGKEQWNKTYSGLGVAVGNCIVRTSDADYALSGRTYPVGSENNDILLLKTDFDGNLQWSKNYGGSGLESIGQMIRTSDGGYALAGYSSSFSAGDSDFYFVKTYPNGTVQWSRTYGGLYDDWANAVVQTSDGGYALFGGTYSFGAGKMDFLLVKTDSAGILQWYKAYGGSGQEHPGSIGSVIQTHDGGYSIVGSTNSSGVGNGDALLIETDESGNVQWNATYGGTESDGGTAVLQTGEGAYTVVGGTVSFGFGDYPDVWLIKTDSEAGLGWEAPTENDIAVSRGDARNHWNLVRVRIWKVHNP